MKRVATLIFIALLLSSCATYQLDKLDYNAMKNFNGNTIEVKNTITVSEGEVFDGNGNLYDWVGIGDCSQKEGMPAMFVLLAGATLQNIWIKNAPDGIHVKGSNVTIDQMVNVDVCEDAISISKNSKKGVIENIKIINSKFFYCQDKAIQLTRGSNILVENNEFYGCAKAVRIKELANNIMFEHNKIFDAKNVIKVTGGNGYAKNNYIKGAKVGFWVEEGGLLTDGGGNVFIDVNEKYRETESGKIAIIK